jgi:Fe-S oxidoreductase
MTMNTYNILKFIVVLLSFLFATGVFLWRAYPQLWTKLRQSQSTPRFGQWGERIKGLIVFVGAQLRLFRFRAPGTAHFFIFWGFLFLSLTILQAILEGLLAFTNPHFVIPLIGGFGPLALIQDVIALCVAVAVVYGMYLRLVVDPERYKGSHKSQGVMVLSFIFTIVLSLLVMNGSRINLGEDELSAWRPISALVGSIFGGASDQAQIVIGEVAYWIHLGVVLLFLTELPEGKHFHVVTSIPAVLLRNLEPRGRLAAAPTFDGHAGVSKAEQFRWRQLLDAYTCTECGRCQDMCPAYFSGLPLSPKLLMMDMRNNLKHPSGAMVPDAITEKVLWSCMTCYSCDQECPLFIEHVAPIVDMRRHLVDQGSMDKMLQDALANLGRYGNSFGQSDRMRAKWTQGVQPAVKDARREEVEYLWFVGDYASYSATLTDVTRRTADVFSKIGLSFGILFDAERNAGNDVRRVGEEGLFEMLVDKNRQAFAKAKFQTIVTTDPHTYNTLKNEYPTNGNGPLKVLHYAELLDQLIALGKIKFTKKLGYKVTYHDPCYLGRYNGVYDAPRHVIEATGCEIVEMPRNRDRAFCCGAGGGRIWMDEKDVKDRPSESRVREAAALPGVQAFVVACPKDLTMFKDAVKTTGNEQTLVVKDLIDLVAEAL